MITVGFAGLPSSGKSTMVNALAGKRVLESGVCRTTTEICLVGSRNTVGAPKWAASALRSDDGVEFCALDLPGMCDAEDTSGSFDAVTHEWAAKCDVVVWVTDARTAFLTTHEARAYAALRRAIQEKADEEGTLYQFAIVLAKYDEPAPAALIAPIEYLPGEIRTGNGRHDDRWAPRACRARVPGNARREVQRLRAYRDDAVLRGAQGACWCVLSLELEHYARAQVGGQRATRAAPGANAPRSTRR